MKESITPLRIEEIKATSYHLPSFIYDAKSDSITAAMYLTHTGEMNMMQMPDTLTVVRESASGLKTIGVYKMVLANKTPTPLGPAPEEN